MTFYRVDTGYFKILNVPGGEIDIKSGVLEIGRGYLRTNGEFTVTRQPDWFDLKADIKKKKEELERLSTNWSQGSKRLLLASHDHGFSDPRIDYQEWEKQFK